MSVPTAAKSLCAPAGSSGECRAGRRRWRWPITGLQLFDVEFPRLVAYGMFLGRSRHAAEDIAQEAFVQLHHRWEWINYPSAYLRQIVFRLAIKRPREEPCADTGADRLSSLPGTRDVEARVLALQALAQLPDRQRAVFALTLDGYSSTEIAQVLGMNKDTARSHLRHARKTVLAWWDTIGGEDPK